MKLAGKTALITGASRGIGASAAHVFAEAGANVVLAARGEAEIMQIAEAIGPRAKAIKTDVSNFEDMVAAVDLAQDAFGGLDILINNAGVIEPISNMASSDPSGWGHAIDINLKGVYFGIRAALPTMLGNGGGTVLNVSSGAAYNPLEGWSHYCSSKAGAFMLTQCLDREERENGIRAIGLSPGTVATEMQREIKASGVGPVAKLEWSDHIPADWPARALLWMCGPDADAYLGQDIALRDEEIRQKVGLIA